MASTSEVAKGYNSFSGVDIKAVFNGVVLAELQALSYSITREKAPLYTMGSADPRSFSRGKRGIAGTLIFIVFDRHALLSTFGVTAPVGNQLLFLSDVDDMRPEAYGSANTGAIGAGAIGLTTGTGGAAIGNSVQVQESDLTSVSSDQEVAIPWFTDQVPPFDITLAAANEYGSLAVMRIFGVEILNEGYGVSIDDIVSEQQMTYVARTLVGWRPVGKASLSTTGKSFAVTPAT
jgi:hypothetical protein